jgi:hypothetical protein
MGVRWSQIDLRRKEAKMPDASVRAAPLEAPPRAFTAWVGDGALVSDDLLLEPWAHHGGRACMRECERRLTN